MAETELELWVVERRMAMQHRAVILKVFKTYEQARRFRDNHGVSHRCQIVRYIRATLTDRSAK